MNKLYKIHIKNNKSHWNDGTDINYFFNNENSALKFMNKQYNEIFEERGISKEKIDNKNYIIYEDLEKFLYFQIKMYEIDINPSNNKILFECGKRYSPTNDNKRKTPCDTCIIC